MWLTLARCLWRGHIHQDLLEPCLLPLLLSVINPASGFWWTRTRYIIHPVTCQLLFLCLVQYLVAGPKFWADWCEAVREHVRCRHLGWCRFLMLQMCSRVHHVFLACVHRCDVEADLVPVIGYLYRNKNLKLPTEWKAPIRDYVKTIPGVYWTHELHETTCAENTTVWQKCTNALP